MSFLSLIVTLIVVGILLGLMNKHVPMDAQIKKIINIVVIIVVVLWLLTVFGLLPALSSVKVPTVK